MSANTSIQWTDRTWNPTRGCSVISPGCVNCYAMKQAHRFSGAGKAYEGLTKLADRSGPQWTGKVVTVESALLEPLSWRTPSKVFVNSMSDLFHEDVPDEFIDKVFAVMALVPRHTFQLLTKRADRMRAYLSVDRDWLNVLHRHMSVASAETGIPLELPAGVSFPRFPAGFPLPNVWLGVSVENQHFADERIPLLLQTPAAVRFISAEPLLTGIDIRRYLMATCDHGEAFCEDVGCAGEPAPLHWVIVGGESGGSARPFDLTWGRSIVAQCRAAGVAVFMKQLGAKPETAQKCGDCDPCLVGQRCYQQYNVGMGLKDRKGGDPLEWPADLRVRNFPKADR